jgi:hypothetical protein
MLSADADGRTKSVLAELAEALAAKASLEYTLGAQERITKLHPLPLSSLAQ